VNELCLEAFMSWEGYNYEDVGLVSGKVMEGNILTSILRKGCQHLQPDGK